ncbi:MAG TPA: hypothetical protein DSN98_06675 [Thermoplasmata archaeon]|nr:MAG TPA: hypothetical protein DSN98_06675 [Thermoplasmata archaeon]
MCMKLEGLDDPDSGEHFFCSSCGAQLETIDEISHHFCNKCKQLKAGLTEDEMFFCWACGKQLLQMGEVAQGLCHGCKASIIRKIQAPVKKSMPHSGQK